MSDSVNPEDEQRWPVEGTAFVPYFTDRGCRVGVLVDLRKVDVPADQVGQEGEPPC